VSNRWRSGNTVHAFVVKIKEEGTLRESLKRFMKTDRNRSRVIALFAVLAAIGAVGGVLAANWVTQTNHVRDLLETKECPDCNFQRADLERLDLRKVDLQGANLQGANLKGAQLGRADLSRADLRHANLEGANLGCQSYSFSVHSDSNTDLGVRLDRSPIAPADPQAASPGFNFNTTDQSATFSLNLGGCANLQGANLQGATMPDGSVHP
jgi:uncharacterized protein YjbI with pentapeptide repeats